MLDLILYIRKNTEQSFGFSFVSSSWIISRNRDIIVYLCLYLLRPAWIVRYVHQSEYGFYLRKKKKKQIDPRFLTRRQSQIVA